MDENCKAKWSVKGILPSLILLMYLSFLAWRMFFYAFGSYYRATSNTPEYNLIPFKTISSYINEFTNYGFTVWAYNLFGNIVVFTPLGFLLPFVLRKNKSAVMVLFTALCVILLAETLQLILRIGVFDIDDIILNLIGCLAGYMIYAAMKKQMGSGS